MKFLAIMHCAMRGGSCGNYRIGYVAVPRLYYALSSLDARLTYLRSTLTGITGSIDGDGGRPQRSARPEPGRDPI